MAVDVSSGSSFTADTPHVLVAGNIPGPGATPGYDVSLDGTRALLVKAATEQPTYPLVVVQNWFAELERNLR